MVQLKIIFAGALAFAFLGSSLIAQAAPAPALKPGQRPAPQNTYVYLYPSLNSLSFEQTGSLPLKFSSTTFSAIGLRAGYVFGGWAVEGYGSLANYKINALVDEQGVRQSYTSRRLSLDLMRRLFANKGPLRISGHLRAGIQSQTLPLVYADDVMPRMGQLSSTNLGIGFALSSYLGARTRLGLTLKWLPGIGVSTGPTGASALKNGFSYEATVGAQHLLDRNWSIGLFANLQGAKVTGLLPDLDANPLPFEASNSETSLQLIAGYQF